MYVVLTAVMHAVISVIAALFVAPYSLDPAATTEALATLAVISAFISAIGMLSTSVYLSRRIRPVSGAITGVCCGLLCSGIFSLTATGKEYSLVLYLSILFPTLLAVLMASLLDRPKSGWQT